jgi:hypothetical protein
VVVAAALALSGCSGDGARQATGSAAATVRPTGSAVATGGTAANGASASSSQTSDSGGASTDSTQSVEGVWLATKGGTKVQLVLGKGKAGLTSTHLCGGSYTGQGGITLFLTCVDGDKERTSGHGVLAADGMTLTVRWSDGLTDTFTRTGLPSS